MSVPRTKWPTPDDYKDWYGTCYLLIDGEFISKKGRGFTYFEAVNVGKEFRKQGAKDIQLLKSIHHVTNEDLWTRHG